MQRKAGPHDLDVGRRKGDSVGSREHNHPPPPPPPVYVSLSQ